MKANLLLDPNQSQQRISLKFRKPSKSELPIILIISGGEAAPLFWNNEVKGDPFRLFWNDENGDEGEGGRFLNVLPDILGQLITPVINFLSSIMGFSLTATTVPT